MKLKFKWLGVCALSLALTGCFYFDYAVDKTKINLPYRTYYYDDSQNHPNHDFTTVIFSLTKNINNQFNYDDFTVYIRHLERNIQQEDKNIRISNICFDNQKNAKIIIHQLNLTYKNTDGITLTPIKVLPIKQTGLIDCFTQFYNDAQLTQKMTETVELKMTVDDKLVSIKQTFPLKKSLHYTLWDIFMDV